MRARPVRLEPSFHERVWGTGKLAPWFADSDRKIGEVWFPAEEILVKFIFTSERLSVQVHPDDAYAAEREGSRGKTEMWHILRAAPDARVALGFREPITRERLREAARSGEIENLLHWMPARPGDTFFTPAGTVHAIGAGLVLCEIQQNSDITYRLYDYGRPRELHLDKAVEVARLESHPGPSAHRDMGNGVSLLASCPHFVTEHLSFSKPCAYRFDRPHLLIVIRGAGALGGQALAPGQLWRFEAEAEPLELTPEGGLAFLRACSPG